MIPVFQMNRHDPDSGVYGDCHRAAIASVLEMSLLEVPHFMDGLAAGPDEGDEFRRRQDEFLRSRDLVAITIPVFGECDLHAVLRTIGAQTPNVYYLLGGTSRNGYGHTVVCLNDQIVHDPSPNDGAGIVGPMEDGFYWLTFFGSRIACASTGDD